MTSAVHLTTLPAGALQDVDKSTGKDGVIQLPIGVRGAASPAKSRRSGAKFFAFEEMEWEGIGGLQALAGSPTDKTTVFGNGIVDPIEVMKQEIAAEKAALDIQKEATQHIVDEAIREVKSVQSSLGNQKTFWKEQEKRLQDQESSLNEQKNMLQEGQARTEEAEAKFALLEVRLNECKVVAKPGAPAKVQPALLPPPPVAYVPPPAPAAPAPAPVPVQPVQARNISGESRISSREARITRRQPSREQPVREQPPPQAPALPAAFAEPEPIQQAPEPVAEVQEEEITSAADIPAAVDEPIQEEELNKSEVCRALVFDQVEVEEAAAPVEPAEDAGSAQELAADPVQSALLTVPQLISSPAASPQSQSPGGVWRFMQRVVKSPFQSPAPSTPLIAPTPIVGTQPLLTDEVLQQHDDSVHREEIEMIAMPHGQNYPAEELDADEESEEPEVAETAHQSALFNFGGLQLQEEAAEPAETEPLGSVKDRIKQMETTPDVTTTPNRAAPIAETEHIGSIQERIRALQSPVPSSKERASAPPVMEAEEIESSISIRDRIKLLQAEGSAPVQTSQFPPLPLIDDADQAADSEPLGSVQDRMKMFQSPTPGSATTPLRASGGSVIAESAGSVQARIRALQSPGSAATPTRPAGGTVDTTSISSVRDMIRSMHSPGTVTPSRTNSGTIERGHLGSVQDRIRSLQSPGATTTPTRPGNATIETESLGSIQDRIRSLQSPGGPVTPTRPAANATIETESMGSIRDRIRALQSPGSGAGRVTAPPAPGAEPDAGRSLSVRDRIRQIQG